LRLCRTADISLAEWLAHTPEKLVEQHIPVSRAMLEGIPKQEIVLDPGYSRVRARHP
jgi:hypothetical protein